MRLTVLQNRISDQIQALNNDSLKGEELGKEINRALAINEIANKVIIELKSAMSKIDNATNGA